jgi:hypothetical protein
VIGRRTPAFIPPDARSENSDVRRMKRQYQRQVKRRRGDLKNDTRPASSKPDPGHVRPRRSRSSRSTQLNGDVNQQLTGRESRRFVAEQNRLQQANEGLRARKEELKTNVQAKGRAAGIPPGYLSF